MKIENQRYKSPHHESELLKKQRQSRLLSPKVTHVYPQIKEVQKIKIRRHHLDDTEVKQALNYDYQQNPQSAHYLITGNKIEYDKKDNQKIKKLNAGNKGNTDYKQTIPNQFKLNSQYFQDQHNLKQLTKGQRDVTNKTKWQQTQTRLKKSISTSDIEFFRKDQQQIKDKVLKKQVRPQNEIDELNMYLEKGRQKSQNIQRTIARYKSLLKPQFVQRELKRMTDKLERQRSKDKKLVLDELTKIKQQSKKLKEEQKQRKKSFKQLLSHQQHVGNLTQTVNRPPVTSMYNAASTNMNLVKVRSIEEELKQRLVCEKLEEMQRKYIPKTNIVNKRIQCDIYNPHMHDRRRIQEKPPFQCNQESDTDSQFSDY